MTASELAAHVRGRTITPEDFLKEALELSEHLEFPRQAYEPGTLTLFRSEIVADGIRIERVDDMSYPPANKSRMQRANKEGEQALYVSTRLEASLAENSASAGDDVVVATWSNHAVVGTISMSLVPAEDDMSVLYHLLFNDPEESIYPYSSAVAHHLMSLEPLTGIRYASKADVSKDENIVFSKAAADELLTFKQADRYCITAAEGFRYTLELRASATHEGGELRWRGAA